MIRNNNIDSIKALACYLVILIHVSASVMTVGDEESVNWWFANILQSIIFWPVPIFLMASGYFLLDDSKNEDIIDFIKKRVTKIAIPASFWIVTYSLWGHSVRNYPQGFSDFNRSLLSGNVSDHLYFLFIILGLYFLAPILRKIFRNTKGKYILYFGYIYTLYWVLDYAINREIGQWGGNAVNLPITYMGYFIIGYGYRKIYELLSIHKVKMLYLCTLVFGILLYIPIKYYEADNTMETIMYYYANSYFSLPLFLISISVFPLMLTPSWIDTIGKFKLVKMLSYSSFGIYLVHVMFLDVYYVLLNNPRPTSIYSIFFDSIIFLIISFIIVLGIQFIPIVNTIAGGPNKAFKTDSPKLSA